MMEKVNDDRSGNCNLSNIIANQPPPPKKNQSINKYGIQT